MDGEIAQVRRFNRTVTAQVGALSDRYLGRGRPLGEARVLWEVGPDGLEVRALRERLELDSGYVSRLLRALEAQGLVRVEAAPGDGRARVVRLTAAGVEERALYDARSDELARSFLAPLAPGQRARLVEAMRTVERLLTAGIVELRTVDPEHPHALRCLDAYVAELRARSDRPFDPASGATALPHETRPPAGEFVVAYLHGEPVACGAVKHHGGEPTDLKRMWVSPDVRGLGLGRRLLANLERRARDAGARAARLETNAALTEAVALYRSAGYVETEPFNAEPYADLWFVKPLVDGNEIRVAG